MELKDVQARLAAEIAACPAEVSVLWQEWQGEALYSHAPARQVMSASVIKVPILCAALQKIGAGEAALTTELEVDAAHILDDTIPFEGGPRAATLEELLTWMIVYSDNTSTNVLIDWLGMAAVNEFCAAAGLVHTRLGRHMLDHAAIEQGRNNYTSALDMYRLYRALYNDEILTPALCAAARHILAKQRHDKLLRRYLWQDVAVAHKTGGFPHLSHDAGVFTLGGRQWYVGVFVQNAPAETGDRALAGRVARIVFDYYNAMQQNARRAVVGADIAPLYTQPSETSELADEALHGMVVELLARPLPGWWRVRTHYRYEGYVPEGCLLCGDALADAWKALPKRIATAPLLDVMAAPKVQAARLRGVPRGGLLAPEGDARDGWQAVALPGGEKGWVRATHLGPHRTAWRKDDEADLREAIAQDALSYLGTQYRWGGKTPAGIDCSGLASMAYLLNGSVIYRDARIEPGFDLHEITLEQIGSGDLLFFPGHVAVYTGGGEYVHATGFAGADGVVVNSLDPAAPHYRKDLHETITAVGSIF